jgi:hypothetical protein
VRKKAEPREKDEPRISSVKRNEGARTVRIVKFGGTVLLLGSLGWGAAFVRAQEPVSVPTSATLETAPPPGETPPEAVAPPKTTPPVEEIPPEPISEESRPQEGLWVPLGLTDVHHLLDRVQALVENNPTTESLSRYRKEMVFCLDQSRRYLEQVSRGLAESVRYKWIEVDYDRFPPGVSLYRDISPSKPIAGVMALRFRVNEKFRASRFGPVFVEEIEIADAAGTITTQTVNRWVAQDLPRREVVYLDHPVEIHALCVRAHHAGTRRYRLYVEAGVPSPPDYPREIAAFLRGALVAFEKGRLSVLQEEIVGARIRLGEFQEFYAPPHNILKNREMKTLTQEESGLFQ